MSDLSTIEPLTRQHDRTQFDCGYESLDRWLRTIASQAQKADSARTFVIHRDWRVVGYYSLTMSSVDREDPPQELTRSLPAYPVGAVLLARLAVDKTEAGQGLGADLLLDSMLRSLRAVDTVAAPLYMVDAIDERAANFYKHFGFVSAPTQELRLFRSFRDIRASVAAASPS